MTLKNSVSETIDKEISRDRLAHTVCCAFEGGTNYWCEIVGYSEGEEIILINREDGIRHDLAFPKVLAALYLGEVTLLDKVGDTRYSLTFSKLRNALHLMANKHLHDFEDIVSDDYDASTGDTLVQLALFGDVIYG